MNTTLINWSSLFNSLDFGKEVTKETSFHHVRGKTPWSVTLMHPNRPTQAIVRVECLDYQKSLSTDEPKREQHPIHLEVVRISLAAFLKLRTEYDDTNHIQ